MFPLRDWFLADRSKHTAEWFNNILRFVRWNMKPLVDDKAAALGMSYMLGYQDMQFIKNLFLNPAKLNLNNSNSGTPGIMNQFGQPIIPANDSDKLLQTEMAGVNFQPLPIMEKIRNILISEQKKMGIILNVRAEDPTSVENRKTDKGLVKNHKQIESFLSYVYTSIGQKPFRMDDHETRFGEKPDAGNTQDFHAMGMDAGDPSDVDFFFKHFHKLDQELAAQEIIDYFMAFNQVTDKVENWVNDIMAKKAIAAKVYVSEVNGSITYEYIAPETVWIYGGGNRKDYNDANAKVIEKRVTVKQLLDTIGNSFDIETQWDNLLTAISYTNANVEFTDIHPSYRSWAGSGGSADLVSKNGAIYGYNQFMDFKVTLGYVNASSQEQNYYGKTGKETGSFYQNNQPKEKYQSKSRYETPTYRSYYLAVSSVDQILFNFGEMPYADIEGYNDWSTNFDIITWKEIGDPLSIQCIPLIDLANEAWYKFKYEARRAKPSGTDWNYDSIVTIAMDMFADTVISKANKIEKVIQLFDQSPDSMWTFPLVDGKPVLLNNSQLNMPKPNGLSEKAREWLVICFELIDKMMDMGGIAPLRQGDPGNPRDSMNNQFKALEYSEASTYYIPDMLTTILQQLANKTVFYAQDIITYKTYSTLAYQFLEKAVGDDTIGKIETLGKTALHRFGIFIESLNLAPMRAKVDAVLAKAVETKSIQTAEYMLIQDIKSPKKAFYTLAFFEQRNKKIAQQQAMQLNKQAHDQAMELESMKQKTITMEGSFMIQGKQIDANANIQVHLINQQGGLDKARLKQEGDVEQIYHQAAADLKAQQMELNNTGKTTPPMAPPIPQAPSPLGATPPPAGSGLDQLREASEPTSSSAAPM